MRIKMELNIFVFLILMLIQTALSVPVDENIEIKDAEARSDYLELFKTPIEISNKLKGLLDEMLDLKFIESSKNLTERLENLVNQDLAEAKAKADDILNNINSAETKKKFQDLLNEFYKLKLVESSQNLTDRLANLVKEDLADVKDKADDIFNHINLAETKKNLQDILNELSSINLVEIYQKLEKQSKNLVKQELYDAEAKFDAVLNQINSDETKKKLKDLVEKFSYIKLVETSKSLNERLINLVEQELSGVKAKFSAVLKQINPSEIQKKFQNLFKELSSLQISDYYKLFEEELNKKYQQELPGIKAKVDDILKQIDSAETKKKLQDLLYDLSFLNMPEVSKRFEKRLNNFVEEELPGVKAKTNEILVQINSTKNQKNMQNLLNFVSNIKLAEISKNLTERLANLIQ